MLDLEKLIDRTADRRIGYRAIEKVKTENGQLGKQSPVRSHSLGQGADFWQLWVRHQEYLYRRCLSWMRGNPADAEEALSQASIKAWEKWLERREQIANPKAWLSQLTHNLCMDMHRERSRDARGAESLKEIAQLEGECATPAAPSPESAVLSQERETQISRAIDALQALLRDPFMLRYCQERPYSEIAKHLAITSESARKRVERARKILQNQLKEYFSGGYSASFATLSATLGGSASLEMPVLAGRTSESVNFRVTAICLQILPHAWYSSPSLLGWR